MVNSKTGKAATPPLKVLLVDEEPGRAAILERALLDAGYVLVSRLSSADRLVEHVAVSQPDIVIVDIDSPDRDCLENMAVLSRSNPKPVIMFSDEDNEDTIASAIKAGVSAYVADGMNPDRVRPIVQVAVARFREFQALKNELQKTRDQLADRKLIDKAKGLLMKHRNFNEDEAYHAMRKLAMERNQRLVDTARNVIEVFEMLGGGGL
ncbi:MULTISPECIES: ANTAR domain-containing protein [unclassified Limnobacter]|jgi:two-component system, response regulator / RNA-binding antiterminator|uniref:ANTAR domain-containing response regulator n=1 Tax=unclassified Limnobacter TaxID=2630203 RepID=UPI000156C652|nr:MULTISPECIES: ANTAR domain-containing protein [unclassified Limnobacter]EDM83382.1 response regulator NasT [Limnobacter sp. MED105]MAZ08953.1 response regulator [Sutterellaceae bacterium]|tara:strand:- start:6314 stop:6937 length:624 start_codon:yes stop_codon:yes gene_type:complete